LIRPAAGVGVGGSADFPTGRSVSIVRAVADAGEPEALATVRRMMAADRASAMLGIELVALAPGRARARMTVRPDMVNGHDIAHGGLVFALADTAFACACNSAGPVTVAAGAEVVFVAPARVGDELVADAALRTGYGRHGIYDVTVRRGAGDDADVVAEFRGRSHRVAPAAAAASPAQP
jgi:acyl-CoA thioesterase